jgi:uncharacterized protein (TIGR00661 family)
VKVLYGVSGEGMGHAMRSAVVAGHLVSRGHDLQFVSSPGRALQYLEKRWPGRTVSVSGLSYEIQKNKIRPLATLVSNLTRQMSSLPQHLLSALQVSRPDVVISDFDPWTARYANFLGIPLIAIDNIHFMNRFQHQPSVVNRDRQAAVTMFPVVSGMVPGAKRYLVTSIAGAPAIEPNTTLFHSVLRPEILGAKKTDGDFVCCYFNNRFDSATVQALQEFPNTEFRVYGPPVQEAQRLGNVTIFPMSDGFIADLAGCKAIIGGAGFTLMSEAVFLGKPLLAVPFAMHFEQLLNANYLELLGYGARTDRLDAWTIGGFLGNVPRYREVLRGYRHDGNVGLFSALDRELDDPYRVVGHSVSQ